MFSVFTQLICHVWLGCENFNSQIYQPSTGYSLWKTFTVISTDMKNACMLTYLPVISQDAPQLPGKQLLVLVLLHVDKEHLLKVREDIFVSFPAFNHGRGKLQNIQYNKNPDNQFPSHYAQYIPRNPPSELCRNIGRGPQIPNLVKT